jgi:hypothetical protein
LRQFDDQLLDVVIRCQTGSLLVPHLHL